MNSAHVVFGCSALHRSISRPRASEAACDCLHAQGMTRRLVNNDPAALYAMLRLYETFCMPYAQFVPIRPQDSLLPSRLAWSVHHRPQPTTHGVSAWLYIQYTEF